MTVAFPSDAPVRLLFDAASVLASARLSGAASFAETLAFVFRNLRWDYEADLAGLIGDIPAHRIARLLGDGLAWQRSTLQRLGSNLAEFATEESALVTRASELDLFCSEVDRLRDDLARLEKRISRLYVLRRTRQTKRAAEAALYSALGGLSEVTFCANAE